MKPTKKHEKTNKTGAFQKTFKLTKKTMLTMLPAKLLQLIFLHEKTNAVREGRKPSHFYEQSNF